MISTLSEAAVALGRLVELSILGKATIILVIGLTLVMLSRRARASVRHLLLTATLTAVLALPLIVLAVPEVTIGVPASQASESADLIPAAPPVALTAPTITSLPSRATERALWSLPSWTTIIRTVWLAGTFLLFALLAVDLRRLYRLRRDGLPWLKGRELMRTLAIECEVRGDVEVLLHDGIQGPLTCGIWRPVILLPDEACEWNEADLRRALVHELEHVRRCDWAIHLAARVTCVLYWLHPLVWVAFRRLNLEAERAADDAVVRSAEHTEYAEQLVSLAGRISKAQEQPALGMANRSDLSARVSALLDDSQRRGRVGWRPAAIALSVAGLVALTLAPVRAVTQARKQTAASAQERGSQSNSTGKQSAHEPVYVLRKVSAQAPGSQSNSTGKRVASALDRELVRAATDGDLVGIDELLRAGANVNCMIIASSPLIGAARGGRLDAVRLLLDRGADPNLPAPFGESALMHAAAEGHVDIVELLLDRGASIDHPAKWGDNALIRASANGHLEVVKLLVARGADLNARAQAVATTVTVANLRTGEKVVKKIIQRADGTPKQGEWRTALSMAKKAGHKDVVDFLLASGARE